MPVHCKKMHAPCAQARPCWALLEILLQTLLGSRVGDPSRKTEKVQSRMTENVQSLMTENVDGIASEPHDEEGFQSSGSGLLTPPPVRTVYSRHPGLIRHSADSLVMFTLSS